MTPAELQAQWLATNQPSVTIAQPIQPELPTESELAAYQRNLAIDLRIYEASQQPEPIDPFARSKYNPRETTFNFSLDETMRNYG